jgi:hypothetical protein
VVAHQPPNDDAAAAADIDDGEGLSEELVLAAQVPKSHWSALQMSSKATFTEP